MRKILALGGATVLIVPLALGLGGAAEAAGNPPTWTIQLSPNPTGTDAALAAVSCVSGGACQAVGQQLGPNGYETLAEGSSNGTTWTLESSPSQAKNSYLTGVSCVTATWCVAVGQSLTKQSGESGLVELWNGATWAKMRIPLLGVGATAGLVAVSCASIKSCLAVGGQAGRGVNSQDRPLAEFWNGSRWTIDTSVPNPHAENGSELEAVSCTSATDCEAGGIYDYADTNQSVFALGYHGGVWTMQKQPNAGDEAFDTEDAMSCEATTTCRAAGSFVSINRQKPLVDVYDGAAWTRQRVPSPPSNAVSQMNGISCTTSSSCTGVGDWSSNADQNPELPLAETSSGDAWIIANTPTPAGAQLASLASVSCITSNGCTAVGSWYDNGTTSTLVETTPTT